MRKKILLVDDTKTALMWEKMILQHEPYDLITASDGLEALAKAEAEKPDLILMDVKMPGMSGLEACQELRRRDAIKHIPVILVTVQGHSDEIEQGAESGCNDHITKPVDANELMAKLRKHLT